MKLLFSILVHEKIEVICNQIDNFNKYNPNSEIILHVSKLFKASNKEGLKSLSDTYKNVHINEKSIITGLSDSSQLKAHLLNIEYVLKNNIEFDYFSIHASNDMFVKTGLIDYISKFDASSTKIVVTKDLNWIQGNKALKDKKLKYILAKQNANAVYGSQVEGIFMKKEIVFSVYNAITKNYKMGLIEKTDKIIRRFITQKKYTQVIQRLFPTVFYAKEEIYFSSLIPVFTTNMGNPYVFMNWKNNLKVEKKDIDAIINNDLKYIYDIKELSQNDEHQFFAVKRIERDIDDPIRKYINNLKM